MFSTRRNSRQKRPAIPWPTGAELRGGGHQSTIMGSDLKLLKFKKNPLCDVIPSRNNFHNNDAPILARVELINKSCFSSASPREQLGSLLSICACSNSLNSSVTIGRLVTVLYRLELGCLLQTQPRFVLYSSSSRLLVCFWLCLQIVYRSVLLYPRGCFASSVVRLGLIVQMDCYCRIGSPVG